MTKVYHRDLKRVVEVKHFGGRTLKHIYQNKFLTKIVTGHFISQCYGLYHGSIFSKNKIKKFITDNQIDMSQYEEKEYSSFNDFFIRKLKNYSIDKDKNHLISPVNGKLLVYPVSDNLSFQVKNLTYRLEELFLEENLTPYKDGFVFVFRLALDDYHRFHYIDDGKRIKRKIIKGNLHTVSDSSEKYKVYQENHREYSLLKTKNFGEILYMEVGALLVGKIINNNYDTFTRGLEKGYFLPGGSTVILVVPHVSVDKDILKYSSQNIETVVKVGERIGVKND